MADAPMQSILILSLPKDKRQRPTVSALPPENVT